MTGLALLMVLSSAFMHATWNLFAKRVSGSSALLCVWLFDFIAVLIYSPLALTLILVSQPRLGFVELVFIVGSGFLHLAYFLLLQKGYKVGDLSLIYPLARGTGPVLSTTAAILFFGERPGLVAISGAVLVAGSVFILTGGKRRPGDPRVGKAIAFGLGTGVLIASYTLWDKQAVSVIMIAPVLQYYCSTVVRLLLITPPTLRGWPEIRQIWKLHRREALGVGLLSPLSYFLVLTALVFTPVSYVAPAREISILIGAVIGTRLLSEGAGARRLVAASAMVLGVIALAIG